jgi:hypothetical protein
MNERIDPINEFEQMRRLIQHIATFQQFNDTDRPDAAQIAANYFIKEAKRLMKLMTTSKVS